MSNMSNSRRTTSDPDMVWTMSSADEKDIPIEAVISAPRGDMESVGKKSTKRYLIAGVVSVIVVVLIIIAILVGMYIFTDSFHKIMQENMQTSKDTTQENKVDLTSNIVEYTVKQADVEAKFIDDYNSYLEVIKINGNDGMTCYVTPLNVTSDTDLSKFKNKPKENSEAKDKIVFVKSKMPIPDISFLNRKARNMCQGITTYWAYRACSDNSEHSKKRATCYLVWWCPYYSNYCYWAIFC